MLEILDCGCKGARSCALCESTPRVRALKDNNFDYLTCTPFVFCWKCKKAVRLGEQRFYPATELFDSSLLNSCDDHEKLQDNLSLETIILIPDFISTIEEQQLLQAIDKVDWVLSQSGRRKQDFGPRVNFKQQKVKLQGFLGMPLYCDALLLKMSQIAGLDSYIPLEMCNLEYTPDRGSHIDFHIDDTWIWGNRLISINLLSGSIMTLFNEAQKQLVYIPMPHHSLLCMANHIRYNWKHGVIREHITDRRIALTMREVAPRFLEGALYDTVGHEMLEIAARRI